MTFLCVLLLSFVAQAQPAELTTEQKAASQAALAEATLDLEWESIEDATSYEVKLAPVSGGEPIKLLSSDTKISQKLPVGVYKVQIRSRDKANGYFGPWSKETEVEVAAKSVQLISPADGSEISEPIAKRSEVKFEWSPVAGAREYTLRIWFDDEKNAREFKSRTPKKILSLPTARSYAWQVTFLTDQSVGYLATPQIGSFKVLGRQLLKPVVNPKLGKIELNHASWKPSKGAQAYQFKLSQRALDETEWIVVKDIEVKTTEINFDKLKPGFHKVEVIAKAINRVSSEPGGFEFTVKPSQAELLEAMKRSVQYQR